MAKNILVVDDELDIVEIIDVILSDCGHKTARAKNGQEALEQIKKSKFDLIISDIRMPQMDGVSLLEGVRKIYGQLPPVILLTGFSNYNEEELHEKGASAFLNKPFQVEELIEVVDTVLDATESH